jgi:hypothetical protein
MERSSRRKRTGQGKIAECGTGMNKIEGKEGE